MKQRNNENKNTSTNKETKVKLCHRENGQKRQIRAHKHSNASGH